MTSDIWDNAKKSFRRLADGRSASRTGRKRHRAAFIAVLGTAVTLLVFAAMLCIGPTMVLSPWDTFGDLFSALGKDEGVMTAAESAVFVSRFPRALAALGVGIGLSLSGAVYQAVIRNPLVDPYIMGVSSGAGTFAVAAIAFGFTLFGLLPLHSPFLTAASAICGGLLAFALTMVLAHASGSSANAYVLSGVVIGLVFSAVQTVLIVFSGDSVSSVLLWLFGSFSDIDMTDALCILVPVAVCSAAVMLMAKPLNLVLLGEDQAGQMGLDVRKFEAVALITASVLASFCVAFCGIIGFVGLVVPHLCRMLFGGDHRLVLPACIGLGGALMGAADLLARMIDPGIELPVGAITTLIGVPVFAYLLFKRGKMYDG